MSDEHTAVPDRFAITGKLADQALHLESLLQDIQFATHALDELKSRRVRPVELQPIEEVDTMAVALRNSAVIAHARCFAQGERKVIAEAIRPDDPDLLKVHRGLIEMRGDHIAHLARGSEHERLRAFGEIQRVDNDQVAVRATVEGTKTLLSSPAEVREFRRLFTYVGARIESLRAEALESATEALKAKGGEAILQAAKTGTSVRID